MIGLKNHEYIKIFGCRFNTFYVIFFCFYLYTFQTVLVKDLLLQLKSFYCLHRLDLSGLRVSGC